MTIAFEYTPLFPVAFTPGNAISVFAFVLICIAILFAFIGAISFTTPAPAKGGNLVIRSTTLIGIYCVGIAYIVYSGWLERFFIPLGPLFLLGTVSIATGIGFTRLGRNLAIGLPLAWLVGFQGFRLPLEIILHDWYVSGTIPETMTWSGSNWDIATGLLACVVFPFVEKQRWLAWLVNVVGMILLINVGRVAIMSSPVPFGWKVDPPLELILYLPYVYIVPLCVGGASLGHVLLTRKLLLGEREQHRS